MNLSPEQEFALNEFSLGKNIFLTGPGGSGKTELIKRMVVQGQEQRKNVQVCALTGCAAILLNCKAKTVHSWAGIGLGNGETDEIVQKVLTNKYKRKNWTDLDILIIDEVSMMSQKLFDILNTLGKKSRGNLLKPFGGLQVVFSGDFYQLPPVGTAGVDNSESFCFESKDWFTTFQTSVQLKTIFRQTDQEYTTILNQLRVGKLYKSSFDKLLEHVNKPFPTNSIFKPTILLPRRKDTDLINSTELSKLSGESKIFKLTKSKEIMPLSEREKRQLENISAAQKEMEYTYLVNNVMADTEIELKIGTQVMCIVNMAETMDQIVNGSQGVVVDFIGELPLVHFNNGVKRTIGYHVWMSENIPNLGVKQIPLIYAWAITIHKAQGVSLEMAQIDAGNNIFACGQTYVALSRVKSLEGLYLTAFNPQKIKVDKKVQDFYKTLLGK
jgi:ATP-dependent DNA helicase PIF1